MTGSYQAAFFDFGGTLYSYRNQGLKLQEVLAALLERLGVSATPERIRAAFPGASRAAFQAYKARDFYLHRDLFMDVYRRFALEVAGREPDEDLLSWCHVQQCERVIANFELRDDCLATLRALRDAGLHVAIVSNIDDDYLQPMIERVGLGDVLDAWTSSEEARSCKPNEAIFRTALGKADCDPARSLFIGDDLEADVAGANPLGMTTVYLREEGMAEAPAAGPQPTHTVERLTDILTVAGLSYGS